MLLGALAAALPRPLPPAWIPLGLGSYAVAWLALGPGWPADPAFLTAGFLALGLGMAALVGRLAAAPAPPWPRIVPVLRWLAAVSYPLYLFHLLPILLAGPRHGAAAGAVAALAVLAGALALAALLHAAVERPLLRLAPR